MRTPTLNKMNKANLLILGALASLGLSQIAVASSTMVTDASGTEQLWTFQKIQEVQKLVSRVNQVDGKGISQTWDANGNLLTRTDEEGRTTTYTYNASYQRISMTEASGTNEARTTNYQYLNSDIDLVTKVTSPSVYSGSYKDVITTYDNDLNVSSVTTNGFDMQGNIVSRTTAFTYDGFGNLIEINGPRDDVSDVSTFEYYSCNSGAECGQLKKASNAKGHVTSYDTYDSAARLTQSTDPNGTVSAYTYHPRGWLLSLTQTSVSGDVRTTTYEYDAVGQILKTTLPDGLEHNYVYDAAHDLREVSDNLGNKIEYLYDNKGNRTHEQVLDPDGSLVRSTITSYDHRNFINAINNGGSVTQLLNDAVGNMGSQTDPNANPSTSHQYDALDRLSNTVDALTNTSSFAYNVADQLTQVTATNGSVTEYEYDDLGNKTKEISADRGTTLYTYDSVGNLVSMTDARGITASYEYDALNRVIGIRYPSESENLTYQYDCPQRVGVGRLCAIYASNRLRLYAYDAWGNITKERRFERDSNGEFIGRYETQYLYDAANRISRIIYPSGRILRYTRDQIGRVVKVHTKEAQGDVQTLISNRTYQADGLWVSQDYSNGLLQTKQYDTQGRLVTHSAGSVYQRDYLYDANGNIVSANNAINSIDRSYSYDVLDRLSTENDGILSLVRDYQYDANGNRVQFSQLPQAEILNYQANSNRLASINGTGVTLDASGRTLVDSAGREFIYNDAGRIEKIILNGQIVGEYYYDDQQRRSQKLTNGNLTIYHYDLSGNLIAESNRHSAFSKEYVYVDHERIAALVPGPEPTSSPSNLALGKVATQSGVINNAPAAIAVDGNTDGSLMGSFSQTPNQAQPWWQVDLGFDSAIDSITVFNRVGTDSDRLADFYVFVSDQPFGQQNLSQLLANSNITSFYHAGALSSSSLTIPTVGTEGRYVRLQLSGSNYLHFSEMQVTGTATGNPEPWVNLALGKLASQISTHAGGLANRGNDGNTDPAFAAGSVSLTTNVNQPWWQVDLGKQRLIDTVRLHQRIEVNSPISERLSDFYVMVSPTPFGDRSLAELTADPSISHIYHAGSFIGASLDLDFTGTTGRYVRVQLAGSNYLELAEVEVLQTADVTNQLVEEPGVHFYVNDHLGTSKRIVNDSNNVTWQAEHTAFGKADISVARIRNHHRFPGQYFDEESGLYYNWNRYYDPTTGRYVTSDPIGLAGGLNTYGYAYQNSLYWIDVDGLVSVRDIRGAGPERSSRNPNATVNFHLCFGLGCFNFPIQGGDGVGGTRFSFEASIGAGFSTCDHDPFDPCQGSGGLGGSSGEFGLGISVNEDGGVCLIVGPLFGPPTPSLDAGETPSGNR